MNPYSPSLSLIPAKIAADETLSLLRRADALGAIRTAFLVSGRGVRRWQIGFVVLG